MKKHLAALGAVAVTAAIALTGCSTPSEPAGEWSSDTLNLDFATYNPLSLVVKDQGWIEETVGDDVEVNWIQSLGSAPANEALRAGAIDVGSTAGSAALLARSNGSPIQTIEVYTQPEWAALVTLPGSGIESVADLRGKSVAAFIGTDPYFFLLQALEEAGVPADEVDIQNLPHADGGTALLAGDVDAWAGLDPIMATHEINAGAELFYRNADFNTYGFLNATEEFITNNADLAQLVVDAYEKAREYALENPEEVVALLAEASAIDPAIAEKVLNERTVIDLDPVPGATQLAVLEVVAPIQVANGDIADQAAADAALATLFNTTFIDAANPARFG